MIVTPSLRIVQDTTSLRERTTAVLRNAILTMRFEPGERLVERQLCLEVGVSRTCIRESMRHLEAEGLVRREHNKGVVVSSITATEATEIYEVRKILEAKMIEKMIRRLDPVVVTTLETALRRAEDCIERPMDYVAAVGDLIEALWSGYHNNTARHLLRSIFDRISYIRIILSVSTDVTEKRTTIAILDGVIQAIKACDVANAQQRYDHYLSRAHDTVVRIIDSNSMRRDSRATLASIA